MSQTKPLRFKYGLGVVARIEGFNPENISWCERKVMQTLQKERKDQAKSYAQTLLHTYTQKRQVLEITQEQTLIIETSEQAQALDLEIVIKEGIKFTLIDKRRCTYLIQNLSITLEKDASLELITLEQTKNNSFSQTTINLKENANANVTLVQLNSQTNQEHTNINLEGKKAQARVQLAGYATQTQLRDNKISCNHKANETISNILIKAVVDQNAKIIARGLVKVEQNAKDCEGYQQEDTLLLANTAEADLAPDLEIANEHVKCSHGATISSLSETDLFYLQSRGITKQQARQMLIQGMLKSVLVHVDNQQAREEIEEVIEHVA